jgi:hypothetical protein
MARAAELLGLTAAIVTLLTFFFRAWANLRRGRRLDAYRRTIDTQSQLELERLRSEIEDGARGKDS